MTIVFDKAMWHLDGNFPSDVESHQAFVHSGVFVGWLADNNLLSESTNSAYAEDIARFLGRSITGPHLFELMDGVFTSEMVAPLVSDFVEVYFDLHAGAYMRDYESTFGEANKTLYHVSDSWDNYGKICKRINAAFCEWTANNVTL